MGRGRLGLGNEQRFNPQVIPAEPVLAEAGSGNPVLWPQATMKGMDSHLRGNDGVEATLCICKG